MGQAVVVVAPDPGRRVEVEQLILLASGLSDRLAEIRVATTPNDQHARRAVSELSRRRPPVPARHFEMVPPARHVPSSWLGLAQVGEEGLVLAVDPAARPASRQVARLLQALTSADLVAGCPAPASRTIRSSFMARLACELAPLLFVTGGALGLFPLLVVADETVSRAARDDPLSANRLSLASALCAAARKALLCPCPVGVEAGAISRLLSSHLTVLFRARPYSAFMVQTYLLALPLGLLAFAITPGYSTLMPLLLVFLSRAVAAATWGRALHGPAWALVGLLLSPVTDIMALLYCVAASGRDRIKLGESRYKVHRGGILSVENVVTWNA